jgi:hypothetical protein
VNFETTDILSAAPDGVSAAGDDGASHGGGDEGAGDGVGRQRRDPETRRDGRTHVIEATVNPIEFFVPDFIY